MKINWTDAIKREVKTSAWCFSSLYGGDEIAHLTKVIERPLLTFEQELIFAVLAGIIGLIVNGFFLPAFNWMRDGIMKDD